MGVQYQTLRHAEQGKSLGPSAPANDFTPHPEHMATPSVGLMLEVIEDFALMGRDLEVGGV